MKFSSVTGWVGGIFKNSAQSGERVRSILTPYFHLNRIEHRLEVSPSHKLFTRYSILVAVLFVVGSYNSSNALQDSSFTSDAATWQSASIASPMVTDQDGYFTKINPQTGAGDRTTVHDYLVYTVESGDTLSTIASSHKLKTSTLVWANNMLNANALRVGQKILVPPRDGISHHTGKNESVDQLAKTYGVSTDSIMTQNNLTSKTLVADQDIFIPGAQPLPADIATPAQTKPDRNTPARVAASTRANAVAFSIPADGALLQGSKDVPSGDKPFIFPTHGKITQGFHAGHYALDIANPDRPAVWAAGAGTVVKVAQGCGDVSYTCNGGYGNHVIIDHGNGLQTLYAHLTYATVKVGQHVDSGEVIGKMGRSGNVRGVTGIHTHWEVRINGKKVDPLGYYNH